MKINVFEGARRIAWIAKTLVVLGALYFGISSEPYLKLVYETYGPDDEFVYAKDQDCDLTQDAYEDIKQTSNNAEEIKVQLCFRNHIFPNGDKLIPYLKEKGSTWGRPKYSTEVMQYTSLRAKQFILPADAKEKYNNLWWKEKFDNTWDGIKTAFAGYLLISLFTFAIGWIVRGFVGIPTGKDSRNSE